MKYVRLCLLLLALVTMVAPGVSIAAPRQMSRMKELKTLQKTARKRLKLQEKAWKRSFHGKHISPQQREAATRQYRTYMRVLRTQQKQERERLKEQLRMQKAASKAG